MAEFRISRFRYTWKGDWTATTSYIKDDIVKFGSSSWVCIRSHTATSFQSDQDFLANPGDTDFSPAWIKMTDGATYRGLWSQATLYNPGDIVLYGGNLYSVVTSFTSSAVFEDNFSNLSYYIESINWTGEWSENTRYGQGDLVRYGGKIYKCVLGHTSSTSSDGPEVGDNDSQDDSTLETWEIYYDGIDFKGDYSNDSVRYKKDDLVIYNGSLLRCLEVYISSTQFDSSKWTIEADGYEFENGWDNSVYYSQGSLVRYGGFLYFALKSNYNKNPIDSVYIQDFDIDAPYWSLFSEKYNFRGEWGVTETYRTGDVVRRGGILYISLIDNAQEDGSTLGYLDTSNWKVLNESTNWSGFWAEDTLYAKGDVVSYLGSIYKANIEHIAQGGLDSNAPGDSGSGYNYWDILIETATPVGMNSQGDLLTFDLSRREYGDLSTIGPASVGIGASGQLLTINNEQSVFYKTYGQISRTFYVSVDGIDDIEDPQRGKSTNKPWKTIRFACEQADDGFAGETTVSVSTGEFSEILPIIIPARTVILGAELRSTNIRPNDPIPELANDSSYTIAVLNRMFDIILDILTGEEIIKSSGNPLDQVILYDPEDEEMVLSVNVATASDIQTLIIGIVNYINFYINSTGSGGPDLVGTNTPVTDEGYNNAALILEANKEFLAEEAVAFMRSTFPTYTFDGNLCKRDMRRYIDAWKYDIIYTGNYKSLLAARYYRNAVLGSSLDDMFYCRDSTGVRNCTLKGLSGTLNPPNTFDLYRRPTGGAYTSLDPGWGPNDNRVWIVNRSPYIQGVTNLGDNCTGIKIDGALHNGGNKSMVANDYTQVLSDGIGAWALNNGRTELVSVFTYYCQIGYYTKDGGIIRATNGNCSYGNYGAISDGVDPLEDPQRVTVNGQNQEAIVDQALAGEFVDEITVLEFINAGTHYTQASASIIGAGVNAEVSFEDFRDGAVFEARLTDVLPSAVFVGSVEGSLLTVTGMISGTIGLAFNLTAPGIDDGVQILSYATGFGGVGTYNLNAAFTLAETVISGVTSNLISQYVGGGGYSVVQNQAQPALTPGADETSITLAANDENAEASYLGKRIIITSGTGTGQYGYVAAYNTLNKVLTVRRDSDGELGWDHVIPGRPYAPILDTTTRYRIEPRVVFEHPGFTVTSESTPISASWSVAAYGETYATFNNVAGDLGTGDVVEDDGLTPTVARFNIVKEGRNYTVTLTNPGAGYNIHDEIIIEGEDVGGVTGINDIQIFVTGTTDDSTNAITDFTYHGFGASGKFVALPDGNIQGVISSDGITWEALTLPESGNYSCLATGTNSFVTILKSTNKAYRSLDGEVWTLRTLPASRDWNGIAYGNGVYVAVSGNFDSAAFSTNEGVTWNSSTIPDSGDSTFNEWTDIAYGKGIFVAVANSNNMSVKGEYNSSTNTIVWETHIMDVIDDSSQKDWVSIAYGNNRFVAISTQGDISYSFDGINWLSGTMPTQDGSTSHVWYEIKYAQGVFFAVGDTGGKDVAAEATLGPTKFTATSFDGATWHPREFEDELNWRVVAFGNPFIDPEDSAATPNTPVWVALADGSNIVNRVSTGAKALGRASVTSGKISKLTLFDSGSGYKDPPVITIIDPSSTSDATTQARIGDGVLTNPEWINRGLGYRTTNTSVSITGDGYADVITVGKFVTLDNLSFYPGPGAQILFNGDSQRYVVSAVTELGALTNYGLSAIFRISPSLKVRNNLEHGTPTTIQINYSQCRLTGHDFLDIGTGNFEQTNYPELYSQPYLYEPESEVYEEDGGRVFYTSTDQSGNFRTGELFAVEQATGIVTISADFFDLSGLTELRLGGIRVGGTGAVVREFSTDALFIADSNNIVPTQRAVRAYLNNRLTVGGSEIATSSFIAGLIRVGPTSIGNTIQGKIVVTARAEFDGPNAGISGSILAQSMFYRSFRV